MSFHLKGSRDENIFDTSKRLKCDESTPGIPYPYPPYLFPPYGWTDPSLLMYWYPALASSVSDGNASLSARLSAFKPWSTNPLGNGKHLASSLLQRLPQGLDRSLQSNKLTQNHSSLEKNEKIANKL